jgi:hypothetical protein
VSPTLFTRESSWLESITGIEVPAAISKGGGGCGGGAGVPAGAFAGFAASVCCCGGTCGGVVWFPAAVPFGELVAVWFALFPDFSQPAMNSSAAPNIIHFVFMIPSPLFPSAPSTFPLAPYSGAPHSVSVEVLYFVAYYHFDSFLCSSFALHSFMAFSLCALSLVPRMSVM